MGREGERSAEGLRNLSWKGIRNAKKEGKGIKEG